MDTGMLMAGIGRAVRRWFETERLRRELAAIDAPMRAELRLHAPADVAALARNAYREPGQLQRMINRLGVGNHPALADWGYRRELEHTCALCPIARTCKRWIASDDREGYRAFCPNATELSVLVAEEQAARERISA